MMLFFTEAFDEALKPLRSKVTDWGETIVGMLPNLVVALSLLVVSYFLARFLARRLSRLLDNRVEQPAVKRLSSTVLLIVVLSIGFFLALSVMNLDKALTSLLAGAGVAGLAVGLALQGTLSNTFAGIFLAVKDVLSVGDFVETNGYIGTVEEITLRYVKIRELDNNIVVIPNKTIVENPFKNYGLTSQIRVSLTCGVAYDSDLEQVRQLTLKTIENEYPVSQDREIEFYYTEFGDSSINFLLRFWVDARSQMNVMESKSKAVQMVKRAFDKQDIEIPFPIRTLAFQPQNARLELETNSN